MDSDIRKEAVVFARYLGAREILPKLEFRYREAIEKLIPPLTKKETLLLKRVIRSSFLLPFVDGGLALAQPQNNIRKRLLIMSALMETETQYADLFLTKKDQPFALLKFIYIGSISVVKGVIGVCLLKCLRWS